jgi:2-oxoglutarate ferredoxin oxidoreductase subunit alpha
MKAFVVVEINFGQMSLEVERCAAGRCPTRLVPHAGGDIHDPQDVYEAIREMAK